MKTYSSMKIVASSVHCEDKINKKFDPSTGSLGTILNPVILWN